MFNKDVEDDVFLIIGYNKNIKIYEGLRRFYYAKCRVCKERFRGVRNNIAGKLVAYFEDVIVLGSVATEVTNEVKENMFYKGKVCPCCGHGEVSRYS